MFFSDFADFFFHIQITTKDVLRSVQHGIAIFKATATSLPFLYSTTVCDCFEASLFFAKKGLTNGVCYALNIWFFAASERNS